MKTSSEAFMNKYSTGKILIEVFRQHDCFSFLTAFLSFRIYRSTRAQSSENQQHYGLKISLQTPLLEPTNSSWYRYLIRGNVSTHQSDAESNAYVEPTSKWTTSICRCYAIKGLVRNILCCAVTHEFDVLVRARGNFDTWTSVGRT